MAKNREFRIFGPPGTGKTTFLAKEIVQATKTIDPAQILVASFTKAAARELGSRDLPIPQENIGTLHAICYRALGQPELAETHVKSFNEVCPDYAINQAKNNTDESAIDQNHSCRGDELFYQYQINRAKLIPKENWLTSVQGFATRWEDFKKQNSYSDFTDLIERASNEMIFTPNNTTVGIFDEVQDFTPLQIQLVRRWGKQYDYFLLAGDDDQLLFSFAGATPEAFLYPEVPKEQKRFLTQSYRVPRKIQALAQRIIERVKKREIKTYKPRDEEGAIYRTNASYKRPADIIGMAKALTDKGKSVMILSSCAYMLIPTLTTLRNEKIPFSNLFKQSRGDWNPLTPENGVATIDRIRAFTEPHGPDYGGFKLWTPHQLSMWMDLVKGTGIFVRGSKKKFKNKIDNLKSNQDYLDLIPEIFTEEGLNSAINLDQKWLVGHVTAAKAKSIAYPLEIYDKFGDEANKRASLLTVGTIHSVKGGEADVVIMYPDLSFKAMKHYMAKQGIEYDSILRQYYVGVTRTRDTLVLAAPANPKSFFNSF